MEVIVIVLLGCTSARRLAETEKPCNPPTTRSARGCHPCLRYDLLPMCPGWTESAWRCAQAYANPSPCYLANIRVIFENNSEPAVKNARKTCGTGVSGILRQFGIREEQGACF